MERDFVVEILRLDGVWISGVGKPSRLVVRDVVGLDDALVAALGDAHAALRQAIGDWLDERL